VLYKEGIPVAFKEGTEVRILSGFDRNEEWNIKQPLIKRNFTPKLKDCLGKGAA